MGTGMSRSVRVLVALLMACGAMVSSASASDSWQPIKSCGKFHVALPNDSWSRLAVRFKIGESRLYQLNRATAGSFLRAGDRVCIGGKAPSTTASTTPRTTVPTAPLLTVVESDACERVSVSWRGASPDTGRYSVQWVPVSSSGSYNFNSYSKFNVRGTSTDLPDRFASGKTYAIRVFAMRDDWNGTWHSTENVTPHSQVVTFTVPECVAAISVATAPTTTVALTCATGGTCVIGDTGPGGGIVFYVHDDADDLFTSTGSGCGSTCRYLEFAPTGWGGNSDVDNSCAISGTASADPICKWSPVNLQIGSAATGTAIGTGYANTQAAYGQAGGGDTAGYAISAAWNYTNNSKSDWHLPSYDELKELCKYALSTSTSVPLSSCPTSFGTSPRLGSGFQSDAYWSSSEYSATDARYLYIWGTQFLSATKGTNARVRPVRAF
jgi:hypothetical protein